MRVSIIIHSTSVAAYVPQISWPHLETSPWFSHQSSLVLDHFVCISPSLTVDVYCNRVTNALNESDTALLSILLLIRMAVQVIFSVRKKAG